MENTKYKIDELFIKLGFSNEDTDTIVSYVKNLDASSPATIDRIGRLFINHGWSAAEAVLFTDYVESAKGKPVTKIVQEEKLINSPRISIFDDFATKRHIDGLSSKIDSLKLNLRINAFDDFATKRHIDGLSSKIDNLKYDLYWKIQKHTMLIVLCMFWMMLIMLIVIHGYIKH